MKNFVLILLTFLLFGCQTNNKNLTFMVGGNPNEIEYLQKIIKEFENNYKIKVNLIKQPIDTDSRKAGLIKELSQKKSDPDVMLLDVAWIGLFASKGWLEPLNRNEINLSDFFVGIIKLADTYNGQIIGLPLYIDGGMLYYREDLLKKYGFKNPPKTWNELIKIAKYIQEKERLNNPNFYGFVWQGAKYEGLICNVLEYFYSSGGSFFDNMGNFVINSRENKKALQLMVSLIHDHKISPTNTYIDMKEEEVRKMFQDGNALFERNWPYARALHLNNDSFVKDKFNITLLPTSDKNNNASTLGGWHISISKFSDKKEEALKFILFMTSYEVQKNLFLNLGWNPARIDVYSDDEVNQNVPYMLTLRDIFMNVIPRPNLSYYPEFSETLQYYVNKALAKEMSVDEALDKAQEDILKLKEKYKK